MNTTLVDYATTALSCLDLTELSDQCQAADVAALCLKAKGQHSSGMLMGQVAAVCVWPAFVAQARALLPTSIAVAAVVNFPSGQEPIDKVKVDIQTIRDGGGTEVDCVFQYQDLMAGQEATCLEFLKQVRAASSGMRLKLILETGALLTPALIQKACEIGLLAGVDFLKTSTGKIPQGASLEAAEILLTALQQSGRASQLGFKPSGGIKTVQDAQKYIDLTTKILGPDFVNAAHFRIGASGIWNDIATVLGAQSNTSTASSGSQNPHY
jgi:deoxyribose-phosphate aldolase